MLVLPWIAFFMAFVCQMVVSTTAATTTNEQVSFTSTTEGSVLPTTFSTVVKTHVTAANISGNSTHFQGKEASTTGHKLGLLNLFDIPKPVLHWFASLFEI